MNKKATELLSNDPASKMLGIALVDSREGECRLSMKIGPSMTNGYDICHGGFVYALADTASAFACAENGFDLLTASNQVEYLAPAKLGDELFASAKVAINSGKNRFCDVKVCGQNNQLVAIVRSKLIARPSC